MTQRNLQISQESASQKSGEVGRNEVFQDVLTCQWLVFSVFYCFKNVVEVMARYFKTYANFKFSLVPRKQRFTNKHPVSSK